MTTSRPRPAETRRGRPRVVRRSTSLLLLLISAALLGSATPAGAVSVDEVLMGLRQDPLYVSRASSINPDRMLTTTSLRGSATPVYAVVVSEAEVASEELGIDGFTLRIVEGLAGPDAVVLVVTDQGGLQAGGGELTGRTPALALERVISSRLDEPFTTETLTDAITDFVREAAAAPAAEPVSSAPSTTRRTIGLLGLLAVVVIGIGGWLSGRFRRGMLEAEDERDEPGPSPDPSDEDEDDDAASGSGWRGTPASDGGTTRP